MSQQQINLYQPMFRKQKKVFSAVTIVQLLVILAAGFMAIYAYGYYKVDALGEQVTVLERQRDAASAQLQEIAASHQPRERSALLDEQLQRAREELEHKQRLLASVGGPLVGDVTGFSEHFAGLGRQRVNGVWLTHIAIHDGGSITLDGFTEQAQLVPRYIQRLGREQAFRGTEFRRLEINRTEAPGQARFKVSTTAGGEQ